MAVSSFRPALVLLSFLALAACEEGANPFAGLVEGRSESAEPATAVPAEGDVIERDVEAPEVFSTTERGLWDGRPSLGGIWVAYPDVTSPERVQITNTENGQDVIGALFRRERDMPGPQIQVSSEAAAALGMLAGQPAELDVVALKRERIVIPPPEPEMPAGGEVSDALASGSIEAAPLDAADTAAAALDAVASTPETRPAPRPDAAPAPPPSPPPAAEPEPEPEARATPANVPSRPYIQIGIFNVEENARNTGESLRLAGILPTVREQDSGDRTYWRVLVGPVTSVPERAQLLAKVRDLGYADAYAVTN